jgi:hypothetical protein
MVYLKDGFVDIVSGETVCYWRDRRDERVYMALGAWSIDRVESQASRWKRRQMRRISTTS